MRRPDAEVGTSRVSPRLLAAALLVLSVTAFGALAVTALRDRNGTTITNTPADGNAVADRTADGRIDSTAAGQNDDNRTATDATDTTTITATTTTTAAADPADMMAIRVEPEGPDATDPVTGRSVEAATATIRADGLLHLEGAFPSRADADRYIAGLADVFGRDNIVETYEINPASPLPDASDVALDKPVLFQSGTATIAPEYIPFLEACGDVLRLNPHITMSISAFTDATGPEDLNLELSRQRAQAIHDFYRSVDVSESQLQSLAFGEAEPVADNDTPDGREQNRRAVLRLLGVLAADSADQDRGN